jgi:hypothetical protein
LAPITSLSRHALVGAALLALGSDATARKRKPKPKPPLAFVAMTVTHVALRPQGEEPGFTWTLAGALHHPATGASGPFPGEVDVPSAFTAAQTREEIVRQAREGASFVLSLQAILVPPERVQVVLL